MRECYNTGKFLLFKITSVHNILKIILSRKMYFTLFFGDQVRYSALLLSLKWSCKINLTTWIKKIIFILHKINVVYLC